MDVILLPCSGRKQEGGELDFRASDLSKILCRSTFDSLMASRRELAILVGERPGPDLGNPEIVNKIGFMPAYHRYSGTIYMKSNLEELYSGFEGRILIISALYGLLDSNDLIRKYNLEMNRLMLPRYRLYAWWRTKRLGAILAECLRFFHPARIHDFLPIRYRKALDPLASIATGLDVVRFEAGQGYSSDHRRAAEIKNIMSNKGSK
jgi:cytoplasmic iron level regulating protein YaaA (DUF328/UPF0246 family)